MNILIQEIQQTPSRINSKKSTLRHTTVQVSKPKDKENLKSSETEATRHIQRILNKILVDFLSKTMKMKRQWEDVFKALKEKLSTKNSMMEKLSFRNEEL